MAAYTFEEYLGLGSPKRPSKRLVAVEDGKWVADAHSRSMEQDETDEQTGAIIWNYSEETRYYLVGPEPEWPYRLDGGLRAGPTTDPTISQGLSWSDLRLVGDRPFGVIHEKFKNGKPLGGLLFTSARQVHKGELGRRLPVVHPQFASEQPITDRQSSKCGWGRLVDLAALIGMDPLGVVKRYFRFTHAEHPALDVVLAEDPKEITNAYPMRFLQPIPKLGKKPGGIWIPQGFIMTVLRLHHLGRIPELPAGEIAGS